MTLQDLVDEVSRLGFETQPEEEWEDSLYSAVNHALREIRRVIPKYSSIQIVHTPNIPKVYSERIVGTGDYTEFCADCGGVLLETSGYVDVKLENTGGTIYSSTIGCDKPFLQQYKLMIDDYILPGANKDITITIKSPTSARIKLGMFKEPVSVNEIQFSQNGMIRYDLDEYSDLYQIEYIKNKGNKQIDYVIDGKTALLLPICECGTFEIIYKCKVPKIPYGELSAEIPLDQEESDLLTLLTASYVLLDEGDGKAAYYMQLYQQELANLLRSRKPQKEAKIRDYYGW